MSKIDGVKMSQPILTDRLVILSKDQKPTRIPKNDILSVSITKSVTSYIDKCSVVFKRYQL